MIFLFLSFKSLKACKHLLLKARHEFEMVDSQNGRLSCMAPSATSLLVVASFLYWLKLAIKCIGGHIQRETMWKKRKKNIITTLQYQVGSSFFDLPLSFSWGGTHWRIDVKVPKASKD